MGTGPGIVHIRGYCMMLRRLGACLWIGLLCGLASQAVAYPLSLEQRIRFKKYLPYTFPKLEGRDPVYVVAIGGSNLFGESSNVEDRKRGDILTGFAGVFLEKLSVQFFYPGGVRLLNPPKGVAEKRNPALGDEIWLENLASPGASVLHGLQRVKSDAFLNDPDLLIIQYGAEDALNRMSIHCFRRALHHILEECKRRKVDVILFGPTPVNRGGGAMDWGITRPYATAARGIAEYHEVLFIDPGPHLIRWGGAADFEAEPLAGMAVIGDRLKRIFHVAGVKEQTEYRHLNGLAHESLGRAVFFELMEGPVDSDFALAGTALFGEEGKVESVVSLRNLGAEEKSGIIGALTVGGFTPLDAARRYRVGPGESAEFRFQYERPVVGTSHEGEEIFFPLEIDDDVVRFPFVIEDGYKSEFVDLALRVGPISVTWKSKQYINIANRLRIDWDFANGTDETVSGSYRIGMGRQSDEATAFSVAPLGRRSFSAVFPFDPPQGVDRFQSEVFVEVQIGGDRYRFSREMEASRDLALGEKLPMVAGADYGLAGAGLATPGSRGVPRVWFDAADGRSDSAKAGLYAVIDLKGIAVPDLGAAPAIRASLTVDGRDDGVRSFGCVSPIEIYAPGGRGGPGVTRDVPVGAFGDGYNMITPAAGVTSVYRDSQLQIRIPRSYLGLHDWDFDSGQSLFGVRLEVAIVDPDNPEDPFPLKRTFMTHYPRLMHRGEVIRGMTDHDARGLTTLRLTRQPMNSWSVRVY